VPLPLLISNELRVVLLHLYDAGFQIQISHHSHLLLTVQVLPGQVKTAASLEQIMQWLTQLKERQEELAGTCSEGLRQFLVHRRDWECKNDHPRDYALACPLDEGAGECKLEECVQLQVLRRTMQARFDEEKPLTLLIEFDESCSPDLHYWAMCTDPACHATGIFPGNILHDIFCGLKCKDDEDRPWAGLTGVTYGSDQEYLDACARMISRETKELQAAYLAARGESFDRKPASK